MGTRAAVKVAGMGQAAPGVQESEVQMVLANRLVVPFDDAAEALSHVI